MAGHVTGGSTWDSSLQARSARDIPLFRPMTNRRFLLIAFFAVFTFNFAHAADKPKLALDDFFNYVDFPAVAISPDGNSVVINTERADWDQSIFRRDLWLYRDDGHGGGTLTQLTQLGDNEKPQWSPDGKWIAFVSERKIAKGSSASEDDSKGEGVAQLYLISFGGGEAFPVTQGDEEVHAFSWSPNSRTLYFATRSPWAKAQKDAYKKEWKDVVQYRAAERGDMVFSIDVADAIAQRASAGTKPDEDSEDESDATPGSQALASSPWRVSDLEASPDGRRLAFVTESISEREEKIDEYEIYTVDLANPKLDRPPRQITHNQAEEHDFFHGYPLNFTPEISTKANSERPQGAWKRAAAAALRIDETLAISCS